MLASWIDTREDNYPCLPPDFKRCLTWDVLEVALPLFERLIPAFAQVRFCVSLLDTLALPIPCPMP